MEELFSRVAKLTIDFFKDPEQTAQMEETGKALSTALAALEQELLSALQTHTSVSIFDELPSSSETAEMAALQEERDRLQAEVLSNRLRLTLLFTHLQHVNS